MIRLLILLLIFVPCELWAQKDSPETKKVELTADFRFRIEHDWDSQKSNGEFRTDRSRLRYRFRFGVNYTLDKHSSFGGRIRSGNINDQQGPHITLGGNNGEFGLTQIGFEKLFYKYKSKNLTGWLGKNTITLKKINELFWNDNVFPEGIGLKYSVLDTQDAFVNKVSINSGHYIIQSVGETFDKDSYLQVAQLDVKLWDNSINLFPGIYYFHNIGNFPDKKQTFNLNYSLLHLGSNFLLSGNPKISLGLEYYSNLTNYSNLDSIPTNFRDQKNGFVISAKYGHLKKKGDWLLHLYYAHLEKYAVVDYFAQNDWARWDYSSINASGSRISNFEGVEVRLGYALKERFNLVLRSYFVEELVATGVFKENGSRIRLDLNIGF